MQILEVRICQTARFLLRKHPGSSPDTGGLESNGETPSGTRTLREARGDFAGVTEGPPPKAWRRQAVSRPKRAPLVPLPSGTRAGSGDGTGPAASRTGHLGQGGVSAVTGCSWEQAHRLGGGGRRWSRPCERPSGADLPSASATLRFEGTQLPRTPK